MSEKQLEKKKEIKTRVFQMTDQKEEELTTLQKFGFQNLVHCISGSRCGRLVRVVPTKRFSGEDKDLKKEE